MKGIFVSYRREDTAGHADRLFDRLAEHFGKELVFMDVEGIGPGTRFAEAIEKAVGGCDVFLAVIGRNWLDCRDRDGRRRLDDPAREREARPRLPHRTPALNDLN